MKTKTTNYYSLSELKLIHPETFENVKEKLKEVLREEFIEFELENFIRNILEEDKEINVEEIFYDLTFSQGSGLMFTTKNLLEKGFLKEVIKQEEIPEEDKDMLKYIKISIEQYGNYFHSHSAYFNPILTKEADEYFTKEKWKKTYPKIKHIYCKICKEVENQAYKEMESFDKLKDEEIIEYSEALDQHYSKEGELY